MRVELVLSGGSEGESVPGLSPSFCWLPAILAIPWLVAASLQSLLLSSHGIHPMSLCVAVSPHALLRGTPVTEFRAHPNSVRPYLNCITSTKILFSNKVTFTGTGGLGRKHIFFGDTIQPTILSQPIIKVLFLSMGLHNPIPMIHFPQFFLATCKFI